MLAQPSLDTTIRCVRRRKSRTSAHYGASYLRCLHLWLLELSRDELQAMLSTGRKAELEILSIAGRRRRSEQALEEEARNQPRTPGAAQRPEERDGLVEFVEEKLRSMFRGSAE